MRNMNKQTKESNTALPMLKEPTKAYVFNIGYRSNIWFTSFEYNDSFSDFLFIISTDHAY